MVVEARAETTAFFYAPAIPPELSAAYDQIVVEPTHVPDVQALARAGAIPVAYFSVGELAKANSLAVDKAWQLGRNDAWQSAVMDLRHPGYRSYVFEHLEQLWRAGYRRFFLDTLDSYQLGTRDPVVREQLRTALCELIKEMAGRHPEARWLLNRGFEILPEVAAVVHGVVAESLFDRWDAAQQRYIRVPSNDRAWLLARLREVRSRYRLPVVVIDYRPPAEREQARATARRIAALDFQPWVCNGTLSDVGVGPVEIMPRHVLILSDQPPGAAQGGPALWVAPVLEYLGYIPDYQCLTAGLPNYELTGRYAGIITIFQSGSVLPAYEDWLLRQVHDGVRVVMIGALGFSAESATARELGIVALPAVAPGDARRSAVEIAARDALIGFEAEPPLHTVEGVAIHAQGPGLTRHLELRAGDGLVATAIATTRFGGLALSHVFALRGFAGERAWVVDPFAFLAGALQLPEMPVPDLTTESGRRVALFAIDAQGLADHARLRGSPRVSTVLREEVLAKTVWPHAIDTSVQASGTSERDRSAALSLLQVGAAYRGSMAAGVTATRGVRASLTGIAPLWNADDPEEIPAPTAMDTSYFDGATESYPLHRVIETFEQTDAPRRLRPLALHYHAFVASSPGGLDALSAVYAWLREQALFAVRVSDYRARVRAFREQVVGRELDGSFTVFRGAALRTLRLPDALGEVDPSHSLGLGALFRQPQGRYVTFIAHGARRVGFTEAHAATPQLIDTNGRIEQFVLESARPMRARLHVIADSAVTLRMAGLVPGAHCDCGGERRTAVADAQGELTCSFASHDTGSVLLTCRGADGD